MELQTARFDAAMRALILRVEGATPVMLEAAGRAAADHARSHMGTRPGPHIITGRLYNSLRVRTDGRRVLVYPSGTTAPYARRIELGFVGADSLGRVYNQPPYPYFAPGVRRAAHDMGRTARSGWAAAIRR